MPVLENPADQQSKKRIEDEFRTRADQWYRETGMISLLHKKVIHPDYQRIIGMGPPALPLILRELEQRGGHWLWALQAIAGIDPASPSHNVKQAAQAWIDWGRTHGHI